MHGWAGLFTGPTGAQAREHTEGVEVHGRKSQAAFAASISGRALARIAAVSRRTRPVSRAGADFGVACANRAGANSSVTRDNAGWKRMKSVIGFREMSSVTRSVRLHVRRRPRDDVQTWGKLPEFFSRRSKERLHPRILAHRLPVGVAMDLEEGLPPELVGRQSMQLAQDSCCVSHEERKAGAKVVRIVGWQAGRP